MYAVYILLCSDSSYYTGLSDDLEKRLWEHETGFFPECYTFKRRPVKLAWHTIVETSDEANKLEKQIKGWSGKKKEALISGDITELKGLSNFKKDKSQNVLRQAHHYDFLIVGQGISGSWLSYYLEKEGKTFLVIDNNDTNAASRVAAGIINPVTGRRHVTVWMADEILPFSKKAYEEWGNELAITAISQKNIIDFFPSPQMRGSFLQRVEEKGPYIFLPPEESIPKSFFNYDFGCGEISPVYMVALETLLPAWRRHLKEANSLLEEDFDLSLLGISKQGIQYKNIRAGKIIFCDGNNSSTNPYFEKLPFAPNKGEALIVEIADLPVNSIYKRGMMLVPLVSPGLWWLGSSYDWEFSDATPTTSFKEKAGQLLNSWLKVPFKIITHFSAVRPATLERRPFVGLHPEQPAVGILNGMGTKGCSLAPFFARQLVRHLLFGEPLAAEADIKRFARILAR